MVADVVATSDDGRTLELRRCDATAPLVRATVPHGDRLPDVGDRVLAGLGADGRASVLAVVAAHRLVAPGGASACVEDGMLVVSTRTGEPVVRYSDEGGLCIAAPEGDVTIEAPKGRVVVRAGGDLELTSAGTVTLAAARIAERARELVQTVGRLELRASRIFESATDTYREVAEVAQLRAGRVRYLVTGALQLLAGRATLASDEDTVVDGKRVLLG
ncbi:MAG: DUF3540 domain-containing protein [Myxococcales bacterium]|nr:DUF3540 domain-containing protein [Myxococcales bacterium]